MISSRIIVIVLTCVIQSGILTAQNKFHLQQFGTEEGLPSNGIKGIQWDEKTGFLWIATEAGIARFNGINFKVYDSTDNPQIGNSRTNFLTKNNAGEIYGEDNRGVIFKIETNRITVIEKNSAPGSPSKHPILLNVSYRLFEKGYNSGINETAEFQTSFALPIGDTACLIANWQRQTLSFYSISLSAPVVLPLPPFVMAKGIKIANSYFLVNGDGQISCYEIVTGKLSPKKISFKADSPPESKENEFFWENGMKNPILINKNKAWKLELVGGEVVADLICDEIPEGMTVKHVQYDDRSRTLFIGTSSKGISIVKGNSVEPQMALEVGVNEGVSYYSQVELDNGNILTHVGHIIGKSKTKPSNLPINGKFEYFIFKDGDSLLWYYQLNARFDTLRLHRYDYRTRETRAYPKIKLLTRTLIGQADGKIFLIDNKGIGRFDHDSVVFVQRNPENSPEILLFDAEEIAPGVLAYGICNAVVRFNTRTNHLDTMFKPRNACVRAIWPYKGFVFFGTYGDGLFIYKNGKIKALPLDKNKYLLFSHCFMEDEFGYCWISTNRGLFKAKLEDMIAAFENDLSSIYYHYFGRNDGMVMTEMNGGCSPCAIQLKSKIISFPTMDGLLWVDPNIARPFVPQRDLYIDEFRVNGKRINFDSAQLAKLSASSSEIQIRLGYPAWEHKENVYIDYQLDDSSTWTQTSADNESVLRFVNLPPGHHFLRIRKLNGFGVNNYSYKDILFTIDSPWYQKWWSFPLASLLIFGIVWSIIRIRTRQYKIRQRKLEKQVAEKTKELQEQNAILEKNDSIKTRLISIINHDIITPLKFLAATGNKLVERKATVSPELQEETIREMSITSRELQSLATNILNWIKYQNEGRGLAKEKFDIHEMIEQVLAVLRPIANQKNIRIVNAVDEGQGVFQFFEPMKILVYNIVSNAINFSEKGTITIDTIIDGDYLDLSIADQGIGMTQAQIQNITSDKQIVHTAKGTGKGHGLGYLIIRDLLKVTNATLTIESEKATGTTVYLRFPVTQSRS